MIGQHLKRRGRAAGLQDALQEECNDQLRSLALSGDPELKQLVKRLRDAERLPTDGAKVRYLCAEALGPDCSYTSLNLAPFRGCSCAPYPSS